jgi:hypothetical protein
MMRNIWISRAAAAFLAVGALALPVRVGAQQSAAGTWTGTARGVAGSRQFEEDFTMVLTQSGQKVTGTFSRKFETGAKAKSGRERTNIPVNGALTGDKLSLTVGKQQTLEATIDGDSMTGSLMRENGTPHHVSATRAK